MHPFTRPQIMSSKQVATSGNGLNLTLSNPLGTITANMKSVSICWQISLAKAWKELNSNNSQEGSTSNNLTTVTSTTSKQFSLDTLTIHYLNRRCFFKLNYQFSIPNIDIF